MPAEAMGFLEPLPTGLEPRWILCRISDTVTGTVSRVGYGGQSDRHKETAMQRTTMTTATSPLRSSWRRAAVTGLLAGIVGAAAMPRLL
jgi:hypothetical protein